MAGGFTFKGTPVSVQISRNFAESEQAMSRAINGAAQDIANEILKKGSDDIASAGNFGPRWTQGLTADVEPKGTPSLNAKITVSHSVPYFNVFQEGGTIRGSPLLWIPFSYTRLKIPPSQFRGGLFFVKNKAGLPMLFSKEDRKPKYFGVSEVALKKRFHILEIGEEAAGKAQTFYNNRLAI
jgi:hypothetical protein